VNISDLKELIESIYSMTGISCFIKNADGETIILTKYNKICEKLHKDDSLIRFRQCEAEKNILHQIKNGKDYAVCQCKNSLIYIGAPILINGNYIATLFAGQVFSKEPDIECFKVQAKKFKFNEEEYIKSIKEIPIISEEKVKEIINLLCKVSKILGEVGYRHLKEFEANKKLSENYIELSTVYQQLSVAEQELRQQYEEMERMAYFDLVTNLPNWNFFSKELINYIKNSSAKFAVFKVDLDNFKNVNDTYGHEYGDKLLKNMGESIQRDLGKDFVVARTSGDEFLILQPKINDKLDAINTAEKLLKTLNGLWEIDEKEFFASVSIGVTIYPDDCGDIAGILRNADIAVNKAKDSGKNLYKFFESSMHDEIMKKAELEKQLRKAIKDDEFLLYYQPQVHVETRKIVSFEALIRWKNKKFGWISPAEFIGLAEETGLIIPIGEWVLRAACLQNKEWKNKGYSYDFISVNVSAVQLQKSDFVNMVKKVLKETGTKPESLEIEITESVMMESLDLNLNALNELRSMGFRVALDDFGTGYSSLNYLKSLPINTLKIDKTFVDGLCKNSYEEIITEQIIKLAHKMDLEVVAEGVELEEQLKSLEGKHCNKIQGYYFAKPLPPEEIGSFIQSSGL
jgi:diguanylate cyclase (GGDEF) domain